MSNNSWVDFNDAPPQQDFGLIPKGTLLKVRMTIKPGGYNHDEYGWTGGWATMSDHGAVYLSCEFVVVHGEYERRKIWSSIGLHSPKGPAWGNMGRSFLRAVLNSAGRIDPEDMSEEAVEWRQVEGLEEFDGLTFVAKADVERDEHGNYRNVIKFAVEPNHPEYEQVMDEIPAIKPIPASMANSSTKSKPRTPPLPKEHTAPVAEPAAPSVKAAKKKPRSDGPPPKPSWA